MDAFMLDGNAVAGLLREAFGGEMTTANGTCDNCGMTAPVGSVHVYRSAGVVLRCPRCSNVLATFVQRQSQICVDLSGLRVLAPPEQ
jgi:ribosomal protein S27AE